MAKIATAFVDNQGELHPTAQLAALADMTAALGRIGAESGLTEGLARLLLEKRSEVERVFADLDTMLSGRLPTAPLPEARGGVPA